MSWPNPTIAWFRAPAAFLSSSTLSFSSVETRSNFSRIAFWSSFMLSRLVEEPDDGELVLGEVAEDLAGDLVERGADVLGLVGHVAGDEPAAAEVGPRRRGSIERPETLAAICRPAEPRPPVAVADPPDLAERRRRRRRTRRRPRRTRPRPADSPPPDPPAVSRVSRCRRPSPTAGSTGRRRSASVPVSPPWGWPPAPSSGWR